MITVQCPPQALHSTSSGHSVASCFFTNPAKASAVSNFCRGRIGTPRFFSAVSMAAAEHPYAPFFGLSSGRMSISSASARSDLSARFQGVHRRDYGALHLRVADQHDQVVDQRLREPLWPGRPVPDPRPRPALYRGSRLVFHPDRHSAEGHLAGSAGHELPRRAVCPEDQTRMSVTLSFPERESAPDGDRRLRGIYYNTQRPHTKFNGGCIQEDHTHWQCEGEIRQTAKIPGLINYYYREK